MRNNMNLKSFYCLALALSLTMSAHAQQDENISIYPVQTYFPQVHLGASSEAATVTITNEEEYDTLTLGTVQFSGNDSDQFTLVDDNCSGDALSANTSCTMEVSFSPTTFGSKTLMLQLPTDSNLTPFINAFFSNDEDSRHQVERRLPPIIYSLDIPEILQADTPYTLQWSLLGYHETYFSTIALFDCSDKEEGSCGESWGDNFAYASNLSPESTEEQDAWVFNGQPAKEMHYSYTLTPNEKKAFPEGDTPIVVRFYQKSTMDRNANESSLSLLVPGGLTASYYDSEGRRISKTIHSGN
ncbi:MAG: choice-of-anchor D domain-containing protein [Bermanella sp.]